MRVIRSAGQNVSPSDDGRLYDQIFTDGLFEDVTITHLGANNVALGAMYGVICGRDFTAEAQTVAVELPEDDAGTTGYIYIEIDTSSDDVITIGSSLAPFTPTYEDLNTNGAVAQMIIAEYVANSVAITSITPVYPTATSGDVLPGSMATVESAQAVSNHSVGEYVLFNGQLYKVISAITAGQTLTPGTNIRATSAGAELNALNNELSYKGTVQRYVGTKELVGYTSTNIFSFQLPAGGTWLIISFIDLGGNGQGIYNHTLNNQTVRSTEYNGGGSTNYTILAGGSTVTLDCYATFNVSARYNITAIRL